jgi:hypothetical protein
MSLIKISLVRITQLQQKKSKTTLYITSLYQSIISNHEKNQGLNGQGHYDKEHITLNESPTPGSVDQGL